jgi:hypothetical protein
MTIDEQLKTIRTKMPETYKEINKRVAASGNGVFALVRKGLRGEANCFWAMEAGYVMGTPFTQGIQKEVAKYMVEFGCAQVCIFQNTSSEVKP